MYEEEDEEEEDDEEEKEEDEIVRINNPYILQYNSPQKPQKPRRPKKPQIRQIRQRPQIRQIRQRPQKPIRRGMNLFSKKLEQSSKSGPELQQINKQQSLKISPRRITLNQNKMH